jgi:arylsulfatase A-like enzyme
MQRRSLVLVTVDCLRADRLAFAGYSRPLMPFLNQLAAESVVFSHAVVAGAPTYFSFPAMMASRYPLGLGREVLGIAPGEPTIATTLRDAGYETAAFIAGNPYLTSRFGYGQGFDHFSDFLDAGPATAANITVPVNSSFARLNRWLGRLSSYTKLTAATYDEMYFRYCQWRSSREYLSLDQLRRYPAADVVVDAACTWLKERMGQPFFLWIHLMDPHHPYYPPEQAMESLGISHCGAKRARFLNSFWNRGDVSAARLQRYKREVMALYDAGVHWVDQQLLRLVDFLKVRQLWADTVFVVTGDHGEEFLEHGNRYHSPIALTEQLIHVPLVIHGLTSTRTVRGAFSLIHLAPTLLESLGVNVPNSFKGRALWKDISQGKEIDLPSIVECVESCNNQLSVSNRKGNRLMAVLEGEYKLVLRFREENDHLYDLKNDRGEMRPLPDSAHVKDRARLLQYARQHLRHTREDRDGVLELRSRFREIRQRFGLKSVPVGAPGDRKIVEIGEHG